MNEQDLFEARLHAAMRRYVADATSDLDPAEFAHVVATGQRRRHDGVLAWPWRLARSGDVAWLLLLALLIAIALGALGVAASHRLPAPFGLARPGLVAVDTGGHVVLVGADGSGAVDVSNGSDGDHLPSWSPDGTRLAFWRAAGDRFSIVVTRSDGVVIAEVMTPTPVPENPSESWAGGAPGPLDWSPDSQRLAFWMNVGDLPQIFIVQGDGTGLRRIGDPAIPAIDPTWSPDGSRIAFAGLGDAFADAGAGADSTGVFVMNADGSAVRRVSHASGTVSGLFDWAFREPRWQPGGDLVAYQADPDGYAFHVFIAAADGSGERDVSAEVGGTIVDDSWPTWSPDGQVLAFPRPRANGIGYQIVVVYLDGRQGPVPSHPPVDSRPLLWSPDGTAVFGYLGSGLLGVDLDGTRPPWKIKLADGLRASWQRLAP